MPEQTSVPRTADGKAKKEQTDSRAGRLGVAEEESGEHAAGPRLDEMTVDGQNLRYPAVRKEEAGPGA